MLLLFFWMMGFVERCEMNQTFERMNLLTRNQKDILNIWGGYQCSKLRLLIHNFYERIPKGVWYLTPLCFAYNTFKTMFWTKNKNFVDATEAFWLLIRISINFKFLCLFYSYEVVLLKFSHSFLFGYNSTLGISKRVKLKTLKPLCVV